MTDTVEIYALCDPSGEIRYIGKANDAKKRFKSHLRDSKRRKTPVYCWIQSLSRKGTLPTIKVLLTVPSDQWKEAEIALIAEHSKVGRLLNVAKGGDQPHCSREVRASNGRKVAKLRVRDAKAARLYQAKRELGMALKRGYVTEDLKQRMREAAVKYPDLLGCWANI